MTSTGSGYLAMIEEAERAHAALEQVLVETKGLSWLPRGDPLKYWRQSEPKPNGLSVVLSVCDDQFRVVLSGEVEDMNVRYFNIACEAARYCEELYHN